MDRPSPSLIRRRTHAIMRLFYRMMGAYWWHEKVLVRLAPGIEEREEIRRRMWAMLGERYREEAIAMGGLTIKAGQILSARSDIFPPEFTGALASLQDTVPSVPFPAIRDAIEAEFGKPLGEIYPRFDAEPLAAASLGQVHRASLPTGEDVVVKVLRPGVDALIRADLEGFRRVVRFLLRWTRWGRGLDLAGVFYESYHILTRELDLREEARHTQRFHQMFADEPAIAIPTVYTAYSGQRVLTLSFMAGVKLGERESLVEAGIDPHAVAQLLSHAQSRQVLTEGFFHADPHPGNLLVQPGPVLVILDFGMVGQLTPRHRHAFRRAGLGFLQKDPDMIVAGLDELEMLRPTADRAALRRMIAWIFEKQLQGDIFALPPEAFLEVAKEIRRLFQTQAFQFPSDIAFLGRGTSITLGVCRTLDPEGNFLRLIESSTREFVNPGREATESFMETAADLARLPARIDRVLGLLESGGGALAREPAPAARERDTRWVSLGTAAVAFLGGNQWWAAGGQELAMGCWGVAALAVLFAAWRSLPPRPSEP